MDCRSAEELFSDHLEGTLHPLRGVELRAHLAGCEGCRRLREAFAETVLALRDAPEPDAPLGLAERAATAALARPLAPESQLAHPRGRKVEIRPALELPPWLHAAAAGFALMALGATLALLGPERPTRAAQRLVGQTLTAGSSLMEHKDRLLEDVRVLGVVLGSALEGRVERVNDRILDYKRLLERGKPSPQGDPKQGREARPRAVRLAEGFRTGSAEAS